MLLCHCMYSRLHAPLLLYVQCTACSSTAVCTVHCMLLCCCMYSALHAPLLLYVQCTAYRTFIAKDVHCAIHNSCGEGLLRANSTLEHILHKKNIYNFSIVSCFSPCSWLEPIFITGCRKKHLHQEDLCDVPNHARSEKILSTFHKYDFVHQITMECGSTLWLTPKKHGFHTLAQIYFYPKYMRLDRV